MSLNLSTEPLLSLREAARLLPKRRAGKPTHASTLNRWAKGGLRGVVLESIQVGGTLCTSREALQRFFERLSGARTVPVFSQTSAARQRADQRVEEELARLGI